MAQSIKVTAQISTFMKRSKKRRTTTVPSKNKVQVVIRCRPLFRGENSDSSKTVVQLERKEVQIIQPNRKKTFSFDRVYGPKATQINIFSESIAQIVNEVLQGYNATIFAYGQTATGKTYTMEGTRQNPGLIPQSVKYIFNKLGASKSNFTMKISCIELYNEELTDLLDDSSTFNSIGQVEKNKLRIYNDKQKGTFVRGTKKLNLKSINDLKSIMEKVSEKRQSAETKLNKASSRSHVITTLTCHITEKKPDGEELIKTGKLRLVDLAGSENVQRSGTNTSKVRSREAKTINQSLLTLGRVIKALNQSLNHIPYRESKLTRLLQDSLGGTQKTTIIATITTSRKYLDETISTLDYAHLAKDIENQPEQNIKITQSKMLKELTDDLSSVRAQLENQRLKNGVYLAYERYNKMVENEELIKEVKNSNLFLKEELENSRKEREIERSLKERYKNEFNECNKQLINEQKESEKLRSKLKKMQYATYEMAKYDEDLYNNSMHVMKELMKSQKDLDDFGNVLNYRKGIESSNKDNVMKFDKVIQNDRDNRKEHLTTFIKNQNEFYINAQSKLSSFKKLKKEEITKFRSFNKSLFQIFSVNLSKLKEITKQYEDINVNELDKRRRSFLTNSVNVLFEKMNNQLKEMTKLHSTLQEKQCTEMTKFEDFIFTEVLNNFKKNFIEFNEKESELIDQLMKEIAIRKDQVVGLLNNAMTSLDEAKHTIEDNCNDSRKEISHINVELKGYGDFISNENEKIKTKVKERTHLFGDILNDGNKEAHVKIEKIISLSQNFKERYNEFDNEINEFMDGHKKFNKKYDDEVVSIGKILNEEKDNGSKQIISFDESITHVFEDTNGLARDMKNGIGTYEKERKSIDKEIDENFNVFRKKFKFSKGKKVKVPERKKIDYPTINPPKSLNQLFQEYENSNPQPSKVPKLSKFTPKVQSKNTVAKSLSTVGKNLGKNRILGKKRPFSKTKMSVFNEDGQKNFKRRKKNDGSEISPRI